MSGFDETTMDEEALDDFELDENEVQDLRADTILGEVERIEVWLYAKLDRMRYYKEKISQEDILFLIAETTRIQRDLK